MMVVDMQATSLYRSFLRNGVRSNITSRPFIGQLSQSSPVPFDDDAEL